MNQPLPQKSLGLYELMAIFPEAKPYIKKKLAREIKECKEDLEKALEIEQECNKVIAVAPWQDQWYLKMVSLEIYVAHFRDGREKTIKKNRFMLSAMKEHDKKRPGNITPADIEAAKNVPIETLIEVNSAGFAHCPNHTDKTPSLKVYKNQNRWWTFCCQQGTDNIDLMMALHKCDFITAVKKLLNK